MPLHNVDSPAINWLIRWPKVQAVNGRHFSSGCAATRTDFGTAEKQNKIIWIYFLQDWTPGEWLNILMYNIAMYTRANIEKTANSQVHLDARSDYNSSTTRLL